MEQGKNNFWITLGITLGTVCLGTLARIVPVRAQIAPDNSLPTEVSSPDNLNFTINGGATAGSNLFHSFREFSIPTNGQAFFNNATDIVNIFSRITGGNISQIDGLLRANGTANLFLINPAGIIFGANAQLNIGGSFIGTTASSILFENKLSFDSTSADTPALLSINVPIGLQFGQNPGKIVNQASAANSDGNITGLEVQPGESLALIGGDITIDCGGLNAPGGRIELGGLAGEGTIGLTVNNQEIRLSFPENSSLANINLANDSRVAVRGQGGGEITVNANNLTATGGGRLTAGTEGAGDAGNIIVNANNINLSGVGNSESSSGFYNSALPESSGNAGKIIVNSNSLSLTDEAEIRSDTFGAGTSSEIQINTDSFLLSNGATVLSSSSSSGNVGNISVQATDLVSLLNASITTSPSSEATGNAGNIEIQANNISIDRSDITSFSSKQGNAGNISLTANDRISVTGQNFGESLISTTVLAEGVGKGGNINISANNFSMDSGGLISAEISGQGDGGNISIQTGESVSLSGGLISTGSVGQGVGSGGDISIDTGILSLTNNSNILAGTSGQGDSGNISIRATDEIILTDESRIASSVGTTGNGNGGDISINTGSLSLTNQSSLFAPTFGNGNAGNISIRASDKITLTDESKIASSVGTTGNGKGGDIQINTGSLSLTNSFLSADTFGQGNAGNISIYATDEITLTDSRMYSSVAPTTVGNGGKIAIETGDFYLQNSFLSADTFGQGNAGNISIEANDAVAIANSQIFTNVQSTAIGNAGDISIATGSLSLTDESGLFSNTNAPGNAGNISIRTIDGMTLTESYISSGVENTAIGNGGDISIETASLSLTDSSGLFSNTNAQGNAGNISINATEGITITNSGISSDVGNTGNGKGGEIQIQSAFLNMSNLGFIFAGTAGQGDSGNISVEVQHGILLDNTSLINTSISPEGVGQGGNIELSGRSLLLNNSSAIAASVLGTDNDIPGGQGAGGTIRINMTDSVILSGVNTEGIPSDIVTGTAQGATGRGGDILINTSQLQLLDGAVITAETQNNSDGGNITVNTNRLAGFDGGKIASSSSSGGNAGTITLNVADQIIFSGIDQNFAERETRLLAELGWTVGSAVGNSGVFANTSKASTGNGGTININTGELLLYDQAQITVSSDGIGPAGNLTIAAESLRLDRAVLSAETAAGNQGNIWLNSREVFLKNNSQITTNATGEATGGNININTGVLAALENSDISANAQQAQGGRVIIDAAGIFGTEFRDFSTFQSDITATSELGPQFSGTVEISTELDVTSGLVQNPVLPDITGLVAGGCRDYRGSSFIVTGRGGKPPSPDEPLIPESLAVLGWVELPNREQGTGNREQARGNIPRSLITVPRSLFATEVVEATGYAIGQNGEVIVTANQGNFSRFLPIFMPPVCPVGNQ